MVFQEELAKLKQEVRSQSPAELLEGLERSVEDIKARNLRKLTIGDTAPDFRLTDATGKIVSLGNALLYGPVILNFYRGGWCPYCNLELNALQRALPRFKELGAQLIAISPESPDSSLSTIEKHRIAFPVLSDLKSDIASKYGIVYEVPEYLKTVFEKFGLDLKKHNETEKLQLPIPATYVIDKKSVIRFAFANEDFTQRADIDEILSVLRKIKV